MHPSLPLLKAQNFFQRLALGGDADATGHVVILPLLNLVHHIFRLLEWLSYPYSLPISWISSASLAHICFLSHAYISLRKYNVFSAPNWTIV